MEDEYLDTEFKEAVEGEEYAEDTERSGMPVETVGEPSDQRRSNPVATTSNLTEGSEGYERLTAQSAVIMDALMTLKRAC